MDEYRIVEKQPALAPAEENEIRITDDGNIFNYRFRVVAMLEGNGYDTIVLKAMGTATSNAVIVAELVKVFFSSVWNTGQKISIVKLYLLSPTSMCSKKKVAGLHQNSLIGSTDISYIWEAPEDSLSPLETTHHVPVITITLSKKQLDTSSPGYQSPIPTDQMKPSREFSYDRVLPSGSGIGHDVHEGHDGHGRDRVISEGFAKSVSESAVESVSDSSWNIDVLSDHSANSGWDDRHGCVGTEGGCGSNQASQVQGREYSGDIGGGHGRDSRQESGNINGMPDLGVNRGRHGYAERGRGRGRNQNFPGRGRGYNGNINRVPGHSVNRGSDGGHGYAERGRGRGIGQTFQGRGRGDSGEIDGRYGRESRQQESGNINGVPDPSVNGRSDGRHCYAERGRGRGRDHNFRGRGRGYNGEVGSRYDRENWHQASDLSGIRSWDTRHGFAGRGRGRGSGTDQGFQGQGRGHIESDVGYHRENMHHESGDTNVGTNSSANESWGARNGYAGRGRVRGRGRTLQGQGRGYSSEGGSESTHQESGNIDGGPDINLKKVFDERRGYSWRGRGWRGQAFRGRGRGYNGRFVGGRGNDGMRQEPSVSGESNGSKEPSTREEDRIDDWAEQSPDWVDNRVEQSPDRIDDRVEQSPDRIDDMFEQHACIINYMGTPLANRQMQPADDNLSDSSVSLVFDKLSDRDITRIGSAFGFVFSGNDSTQAVALIRQLEKQRAKLKATL